MNALMGETHLVDLPVLGNGLVFWFLRKFFLEGESLQNTVMPLECYET